ncbi:RNA polymerase sigma factor [Pseudoalteromonas xiamenensis]
MVSNHASTQTFPVSMDAFLQQVERKGYRMAEMALGSHADALDVLQEAMTKLVIHYSDKPCEQWKPLFYKILQNAIRDWQRQQKLKNMLFFWRHQDSDDEMDWPDNTDSPLSEPDEQWAKAEQQAQSLTVLKALPTQQQQCFLLRSWEGLSVKETADVMGCSEGSVKTHYSRAVAKLKVVLEGQDDKG